jgi:hypothetical protein
LLQRGSIVSADADVEIPSILTVDSVYPVPAGDVVTLRIGVPYSGELSVELYDVLGRLLLSISAVEEAGWLAKTLNTSGLNPGLFFVRVIQGGATQTASVVVNR